MLRPLPFATSLLFPILCSAQMLPGMWPQDTLSVPCPNDSAQTIRTFNGWEAYQTQNDHWDGPRDTTHCIDLWVPQGNYILSRIEFDQTDISHPVFLRARLDSASALALESNTIYGMNAEPYFNQGPPDTSTCAGGPCTGMLVAVRVPDSAGTGHVLRWHDGPYEIDGYPPIDLCVPTERFPDNALREVVLSFKPGTSDNGQFVQFYPPTIQNQAFNTGVQQLTEAAMPTYLNGQYDYYLNGLFGPSYLVMYEDSTYPDVSHPSYLDISPSPNVAVSSTVTLTLDEYATMVFQPYAQFRGGLVAGSDSVRHNFVFVNSGDLCMSNQFVELVFGAGNSYVHAGGHVDMDGRYSCFAFRNGSTLKVTDGIRFNYGKKGSGILALRSGCTVDIGHDAMLVIHNMMDIKEDLGITEHRDVELTLRDGARLVFAPGSRVHNANSIGQACKLVVRLDGGSIDISRLSPEDREKVVVIHLPSTDLPSPLLAGNLLSGDGTLQLAMRESGTAVIQVTDMLGRVAMRWQVVLSEGSNTVPFAVGKLGSGQYVLAVRSKDLERVERFVRP